MDADERYAQDCDMNDIDFSKPVENKVTPPDPQHGRDVKPLAQYLGEYVDHELCSNTDHEPCSVHGSWHELLEQALDAYQSTESVTIKIERNE